MPHSRAFLIAETKHTPPPRTTNSYADEYLEKAPRTFTHLGIPRSKGDIFANIYIWESTPRIVALPEWSEWGEHWRSVEEQLGRNGCSIQFRIAENGCERTRKQRQIQFPIDSTWHYVWFIDRQTFASAQTDLLYKTFVLPTRQMDSIHSRTARRRRLPLSIRHSNTHFTNGVTGKLNNISNGIDL